MNRLGEVFGGPRVVLPVIHVEGPEQALRNARVALAAAARAAAASMDVVTTSGPGTGQAAAPDKLRRMKEALGVTPLAIASGVTPENVGGYLPWVDCFLVATGISRTFEEFDPGRVR